MSFNWAGMEGRDLQLTKEIDFFDTVKTQKMFGKLQFDIDKAMRLGLRDASISVKNKLESLLEKYNVGVLKKDIWVIPHDYGFEIQMDSQTAIFVEYGTGVVGSRSKHPETPWEYDVNKHGDQGWLAPVDELGVSPDNPWKFVMKDGIHTWTKGMPSRPFFWELVKWVKSYGIVARCINKRLRAIK